MASCLTIHDDVHLMTKVLPLELASKYSQFHSSALSASDFDAKPMVLLLGQYSVGKTSFIRSLLQRDFPGGLVGIAACHLIAPYDDAVARYRYLC